MLFKIVSFRKQSASGMRCQTIYSPCTIPPHLQDSNLPWELQSPILLIINSPTYIFAQSCWEERHFNISYPLHSLFYCFFAVVVLTVTKPKSKTRPYNLTRRYWTKSSAYSIFLSRQHISRTFGSVLKEEEEDIIDYRQIYQCIYTMNKRHIFN